MTDLLPGHLGSAMRSDGGAAQRCTVEQRTRVVLDTSVLVADPGCLNGFSGFDVVIPLTVIEELDGLKGRMDDVGRAARTALRTIEELRVRAGGSLAEAVALSTEPDAGTLKIEINGIQKHLLIEHGLDPLVADNRIIGAALGQAAHAPTVIVSNDAALRIKAAHLGLAADEHRPVGRSASTRSPGWQTIDVDQFAEDCELPDGHRVIDALYATGAVPCSAVSATATVRANEFVVVRCGSQSALTRCCAGELVLLGHGTPEAWGLRSRSKEQRFALDLLLDPDVSVVALDGRAGTGKTLLAIAAGLEQVVERRIY
ncbi:MAG: PIN domain-containing protein, partial [Ilumatobacteraceae bacterium]